MIRKMFFLLPMFAAVVCGYWIGTGTDGKTIRLPENRDQDNAVSVSEHKSFAIVVYAYKNPSWCIRMLRSIFEQDYDHFRILFFDDGSQDGTQEQVQSFILENNQEDRVIIFQNAKKLGPVACLYRAVNNVSDQEIVISIDAKDWFAHPNVLSRLNAVYQNSNVWLTEFCPIFYPSYEMGQIVHNQHLASSNPISFYAKLFKQVRLADLMKEGHFVEGRNAYLAPILQMAGPRTRIVEAPSFIVNQARCCKKEPLEPVSSYSQLNNLPDDSPEDRRADIVLFSYDRPMQLFSCLESICRYFSGYEQIVVLCRSSNERCLEGYRTVQKKFPEVRFVFQASNSRKDFKPLLLKILFESKSPFVLFGVDDQIVTDFADLRICMEAMEKTKAYGFYLRLGQHITYSYQTGRNQNVPSSIPLGQGIFAWNIHAGYSDWEFPNSLDMTLYRKKNLKEAFEQMRYKSPNSLEFVWAKGFHFDHEIGLYFERSKVVNIPLNVVSDTGNPHMNDFSSFDLLAKFEEGFKIDIDPLYRIENPSPHFEYLPRFILRTQENSTFQGHEESHLP